MKIFEKFSRSERGYTFIELLLALTMLALMLLPLTALFHSGCRGAAGAGRRTAAANLCREQLEALKAAGHARCLKQIEESAAGRFSETEELPLNRTLYRRLTALQLTSIPTEDEAAEIPLIHITVSVTWPEGATQRTLQLETHLAPR